MMTSHYKNEMFLTINRSGESMFADNYDISGFSSYFGSHEETCKKAWFGELNTIKEIIQDLCTLRDLDFIEKSLKYERRKNNTFKNIVFLAQSKNKDYKVLFSMWRHSKYYVKEYWYEEEDKIFGGFDELLNQQDFLSACK